MTSYIPGAGLKKPLNQLQNPIYPDIRKGPPIFKWSGKHFTVDVGRTNLDSGKFDITTEGTGAILTQNRDYNRQFAYGTSSFKDVVNQEFRPPLITMEDTMPLTRIPRPLAVPRINPGMDGVNPGFAYQNNQPSEKFSYLTERIKEDEWFPGIHCPLDMPLDNSVLPDLELKLPTYSASAGFNLSNVFEYMNSPPQINGDREYYETSKILPDENSGYNIPFNQNIQTGMENIELIDNRPQVSGSAGFNTLYNSGLTPVDIDLDYKTPQVSASAGFNTSYNIGTTPVDIDLEYKSPQVSGSAGYQMPYTQNGQTRVDFLLDEKINSGQTVINPSSSYQSDNYLQAQQPIYIDYKNPQVSYVASKNIPYQTSNERSVQNIDNFQIKKKSLAKYRGYEQKPYIPRAGVNQIFPVNLKQK